MDPIAHTCSGILLGQGLRPLTAVRKTTLLVAGLAALSPDGDSASYLWRTDAFYRVHHTYTHTLVGLVVVALMLATIERRWLTGSCLCAYPPQRHRLSGERPSVWQRRRSARLPDQNTSEPWRLAVRIYQPGRYHTIKPVRSVGMEIYCGTSAMKRTPWCERGSQARTLGKTISVAIRSSRHSVCHSHRV